MRKSESLVIAAPVVFRLVFTRISVVTIAICTLFPIAIPALAKKLSPSMLPVQRGTTNFDFDWRFHLGEVPGAEAPGFDDSAWRQLDVPHDWSIEGAYRQDNPGVAVSGWLPTGIGWYRKTFEVTPEMLRGNVVLLFDGVFMDSTTWVNGVQLGEEPYGYMSFYFDISAHLHPGANTIAVRVNNLLQPAARWYTGSGIYGHVKLLTMPAVHVPLWSTFVRTHSLNSQTATVAVSTAVQQRSARIALQLSVLDPDGKIVARRTVPASEAVPDLDHPAILQIPHPRLWSPDEPNLYILRTELVDGKQLVDSEDTTFGVRTTVFDPNKGFLLNGQVLKLRGVGDHLYGGPMGTAIPDGILQRRLQMLKDMGVNAIRTSHNPHTPYFYDLCDRMGFLVMDEIYDGWHKKVKNEYAERFYASQWHHDVERWVRRDRNHPSVFVWSLGNETGLADVNHMTEYVHTFDPTRPTTGGMMTTGVGVSGWNGPGEVPGVLEKFHAEHPTIPIMLTEEPHTLQTRGYYRVRTWWRDWKPGQQFEPYGTEEIFFDGNQWYNSSYDNAIVRNNSRQSWKRTASTPWIAGEFRWLGFDYIGEAAYKGGHWPVRAENFGIIDLAGIPKDDYFLYQAFWTKKPMVHLLPHWTHRNMEGIVIPVVAYSNEPEVELFLNGVSLGRIEPGPLGDFLWKVPYRPGKLLAVAYDVNGKRVANTSFTTAGDPTGIKLETDNGALRSNRTDDAVVTFTVVDKDGVMVPWNMNRIVFKVLGSVHLLGNENGDPVDVTPNQASYRNAFYGMGRGFYQATADDGPIEITAASILGDTAIWSATQKNPRMISIAVSRVSLRGPLENASFEIHYTTDGSEPTLSSPLFKNAFGIYDDTNVQALITRNGKPWIRLSQGFHRVEPTLVTDPRWATDSTIDPLMPRKDGSIPIARKRTKIH